MTTRPLLAERRFAPLFWCQFLSAFNDNLLKNALVFLLLWGVGGEGAGAQIALGLDLVRDLQEDILNSRA